MILHVKPLELEHRGFGSRLPLLEAGLSICRDLEAWLDDLFEGDGTESFFLVDRTVLG